MKLEKTSVPTTINVKGVRIELTIDELGMLLHFIKCRNTQGTCAIVPGGYDECVRFALDFADGIERLRPF